MHGTDSAYHLLRRGAFAEITRRTRLHHFSGQRVFSMDSQHDNFDMGIEAHDFSRRLEPADAGHVHIHQDHVDLMRSAPFHRVLAATGLSRDHETFHIFQYAANTGAHQFMVINKKNTDQRGALRKLK